MAIIRQLLFVIAPSNQIRGLTGTLAATSLALPVCNMQSIMLTQVAPPSLIGDAMQDSLNPWLERAD